MGRCEDECYEEYEECIEACQTDPVPDTFDYMPAWLYRKLVCYPACFAAYTACLAKCKGEQIAEAVATAGAAVVDWVEAAAQYVRDHPELVVGTIVIIAGVVLIATTGPGGAIVLVAA